MSDQPLRFSPDGRFRVLMMSDVQERADFDACTLASMTYLLEEYTPSLVMLGGDNCFGPDIRTEEELDRFLARLVRPMEERGVPWAHIFGNHDHDIRCVEPFTLQAKYERYPHCVSRHSEGLHGVTNFYLDILDEADAPAFRLWALDTNGKLSDSELNARFDGGFEQAAILPVMYGNRDRFDLVYFDQLDWYYRESLRLEAACGRIVPGMMFAHIAPEEFNLARDNPLECRVRGSAVERLAPAALNSGLFSLLLQRGEIGCLACAHTHMNSFEADYCGVRLCFDACAGYTCYGLPEERGGRIFDLDVKQGLVDTQMILTSAHL